jgi:hypothetical protein
MTPKYWQCTVCILFPQVSTLTAYPPEWQIHGEEDFEGFNPDPDAEEEGLGMALLANVDQDGRLTDTFKCCFFGTAPTKFTVSADKVFANPPEHIRQMEFCVSANLKEMSPLITKATSTRWKNFTTSIKDRTIIVIDKEGKEVDSKPVIEYLTTRGCSTRWAVGATRATGPPALQMEFQVLPAPEIDLNKKKKKFSKYSCASILVACFPLQVKFFDGNKAAGPVPILFAANKEAARCGLKDNVEANLELINKLNSQFLFLEHITMGEAMVFVQGKVTSGQGKVAYPLPKIMVQSADKKKSKQAASSVILHQSKTGMFLFDLTIKSIFTLKIPSGQIGSA